MSSCFFALNSVWVKMRSVQLPLIQQRKCSAKYVTLFILDLHISNFNANVLHSSVSRHLHTDSTRSVFDPSLIRNGSVVYR